MTEQLTLVLSSASLILTFPWRVLQVLGIPLIAASTAEVLERGLPLGASSWPSAAMLTHCCTPVPQPGQARPLCCPRGHCPAWADPGQHPALCHVGVSGRDGPLSVAPQSPGAAVASSSTLQSFPPLFTAPTKRKICLFPFPALTYSAVVKWCWKSGFKS